VNQVLATTPNLQRSRSIVFYPGVQQAPQQFSGFGDYVLENGVKEVNVWMPSSIDWPKPSTATNNLKWTIPFNYPLLKSIMPLREPADRVVANPDTPRYKP